MTLLRLPAALALLLLGEALAADVPGALELYPPTRWSVQSYVDNFDFTNDQTFTQHVLSYEKWWKPGNPILLYLGNEAPIGNFYNYTGALFEHAQALGAAAVFIEHRCYGASNACGNTSMRSWRYLTVDQAMADYAWFVRLLRQRLKCGDAECPIVTFGGSYGGMLVAWFRQKYPHLTVGGIAGSAPIDFYAHSGVQSVFWNATLHTFRAFGTPSCAVDLVRILDELVKYAVTTKGRDAMTTALGSCDGLGNETTAGEKADFFIRGIFASLAMLDYPVASNFVTPLPANPVMKACSLLQGEPDPLRGLRAVANLYLNATGGFRCYDILAEVVGRPTLGVLKGPRTPPDMGPWQYQACNELILEPISTDGFGFYPPSDAQIKDVAAACWLRYGVRPRPDWLPLSTGASEIRVGGLFFTDGEKDPWRAGAVNLSKVPAGLDVTHHLILGAAHHEDLRFDPSVPRKAVVEAKQLALAAMRRWISSASAVSSASNAIV